MTDLVYNSSIRSVLAELASLDPEVGPDELICLWFDDLYFPGGTWPEMYNPGVWERGLREWKACFTDHEFKVLAEFHEVFKAEVDTISTKWSEWEQDPKWQKVRDAARLALAKL